MHRPDPQGCVHVQADPKARPLEPGCRADEFELGDVVHHQRDRAAQARICGQLGKRAAVRARVADEDVVDAEPGEPDRLPQREGHHAGEPRNRQHIVENPSHPNGLAGEPDRLAVRAPHQVGGVRPQRGNVQGQQWRIEFGGRGIEPTGDIVGRVPGHSQGAGHVRRKHLDDRPRQASRTPVTHRRQVVHSAAMILVNEIVAPCPTGPTGRQPPPQRPRASSRPEPSPNSRMRSAARRTRGTASRRSEPATPSRRIAITDGVQLRLDKLNGIVRVDQQTGLVTVRAGTRLHELTALLWELGLSMSNLGDIDVQTLSGAISTGTHGTGIRLGGLATQVRAMQIVLADGTMLDCSPAENADVFAAARVGLGALGVLATITLQCEPAFALRAVRIACAAGRNSRTSRRSGAEQRPFRVLLVPAHPARADQAEQPCTGWYTACAGRQDPRVRRRRTAVQPRVRVGEPARHGSSAADPAAQLDQCARAVAPASTSIGPTRCSPRRARCVSARWSTRCRARPCRTSSARSPAGSSETTSGSPSRSRYGSPPPTTSGSRRPSSASPATSPCTSTSAASTQRYFDAVEAIARSVGGRPHWGKLHRRDAASLRECYPRFDDFVALRDRLDPDRVFGNDYLEQVLGR